MTALVVYESMFGNTRDIAAAICRGLLQSGVDARLLEVSEAPLAWDEDHDLLVVGAPTHAFGLSRASTRADAARQADTPVVSGGRGVREWLDLVGPHHRARFAAFDTKVRRPLLPGSAARSATKRLRHMRWHEVVGPESFFVDGVKGPLLPGELLRAETWGTTIAVAERELLAG